MEDRVADLNAAEVGGLAGKGIIKVGENAEDRVILVDKPADISSFGVVAKVRGALRAEFGRKVKVGHTGTLDPFATGLLILLSGKMTKKSAEFLKLDKWYEAEMRLGYVSTTGDPEGEIRPYLGAVGSKEENRLIDGADLEEENQSILNDGDLGREIRVDSEEGSVVPPSLKKIEAVISRFVGKIEQTPPRYSAIKINGQRAYKLARKGAEFELPKREVEIYAIEILRYEWPELTIRCHVSSGTYIRTLAEDIGEALGVGAYLTSLRRLTIGEYRVEDAVRLEDL